MIDAVVAVRLALYLDLMLVFGLTAVAWHTPSEEADFRRYKRVIGAGALAGVALSGAGLVIVTGAMSGVALRDVDFATAMSVASETAAGMAIKVRIVALIAVAALAALSGTSRVIRLGMTAGGAVAVASLAWLGHGARDEGGIGTLHLAADIVHLLAAAVWLGMLAALMTLLSRPIARIDAAHLARSHTALAGFATIGTVVVGLIVATGLINAWLLIGAGQILSLAATLYGRLLIVKLALFAAMLGLAASNRFRLTPALAHAGEASAGKGGVNQAIWRLRVSLATETSAAVAVLALVAWLGTLAPPIEGM